MISWNILESLPQYEQLKINSSKRDQVLFKHSQRCSISLEAKHKLDTSILEDENKDYYIIDVVAYRDLARMIADDSGIIHQSPQILLFRDGKVVYDTSHWAINKEEILQQ